MSYNIFLPWIGPAADTGQRADLIATEPGIERLRELLTPPPESPLTWPVIDPTLLDKKPEQTGPTPAEQAAERLGFEPFGYCERN